VAAGVLTVADLRSIDLFDELDDEQLARWVAAGEERHLASGETLERAGQGSAGLHLILEGTIQMMSVEDGRLEPLARHVAPTWMGAIPVLTEMPVPGLMRADGDVRLVTIDVDDAYELIVGHRPVFRRVMAQIRPVMARITQREQNRERLASLGTMAAGLAHELNNPAAAARRSASAMCEELAILSSTIGHFVAAGVSRDDAEQLVALQREALDAAADRTALSALDAADAEDELRDALEDAGLADGWKYAEALAGAGLDAAWLARVQAAADGATEAAVAWVAASLTASGLAAQIVDSTERMSQLVGAVKSYAYMDQGDVVEVDVHEGLETTLVVLGHKLKHTRIDVVREYDRDLPHLIARGGELNQVWTNLLDNAIGALGETGTITISTRQEGDCAVVDVADDGPGIPPEVVDRVFDPFFTTKGVGEGTGLGLDTARRIVQERHRGSLSVVSEPGRTVFSVWLPLADTTR
jgi:signal transduction histidine kinase